MNRLILRYSNFISRTRITAPTVYFRGLCHELLEHGSVVSPSEVTKRRQSLAMLLGWFVSRRTNTFSRHVLIFPSSEVQYMAHHIPYPFHQNSHFFYLTNFNEPNAVLAITLSVEPSKPDPVVTYSEHLFIELRNEINLLWDGPTVDAEKSAEITGVQSVSVLSDFSQFLESVGTGTILWYSPLVRSETENQVPNKFVFKKLQDFVRKTQRKNHEIECPSFMIDSLRYVKSAEEIRLLQLANSLTSVCLKRSMAVSYPGVNEATLQGHMELEARSHGSLLSYPPVIAGGCRALTIHYLRNNRPVHDGDLVLVDVGCQSGGYTADISRTWPVNGRFTSVQLLLHDILEDVQHKCVKFVTCDHSLHDVHQLMIAELEHLLVSERIIPHADANKIVRQICPHSVGHFLGLDVHDTPSIPQSRRFEPGVVFTLEPGVYMRPELKKHGVPEEFIGYGLRLEDDFVISPSGVAVRLTDQLPTSGKLIQTLVGKSSIQVDGNFASCAERHPN